VARGERYLSAAAQDKVIHVRGRRVVAARTRYDRLTGREREVLRLLADGLSVKEVAVRLERSTKTAEAHKYNLMRKLGVHDRAGLVKYAIAHRLIREVKHPIGVAEQPLAALRERQPIALAREELHADRRFELLDARRDIGGDAMQPPRRANDAALTGHGAEDVKIGEFHGCASVP
jgi:DNA-binding CsgD family transcriptional regulator